MSGVHDAIVVQALRVLPDEERKLFVPYVKDLENSSWYPDIFADSSMSPEAKATIDSEADRFIYPPAPAGDVYERILVLTEEDAARGTAPLRYVYLIDYYLRSAVQSLQGGDARSAAKFCGVYSHLIADAVEPIHAVNPTVLDLVLPPPEEYVGLELHANVEGLAAPVEIGGYQPQTLGNTIPRAVMGGYAGMEQARRLGAAQAAKIVQALYSADRERAVRFSQIAQNESARKTADFMHTACSLALGGGSRAAAGLDLTAYPCARAEIDMLYRFRPLVDISMIPYANGRYHPLSLLSDDGLKIERVHGLGALPFLGPPFSRDCVRRATIEYYLVPGAYKHFRARVGANPLFKDGTLKLVFTVIGDGRELFRSGEMGLKDSPALVDVALGQTSWLTLATQYTVNPTPDDVRGAKCRWALHAVWAEPRLE